MAAAKKTAGRHVTVNTNTVKSNVTLQYGEKSIPYEDLVSRVKDIWTGQFGRKIIEIDSVELYIKPEENKVYYVINKDINGDFDL
ncbi:MAG: hypothetical protein IKO80_03185 [Lachnospiraceae bacterium]|nr:hypothetical protein [Lachnospiraceae bacterium]